MGADPCVGHPNAGSGSILRAVFHQPSLVLSLHGPGMDTCCTSPVVLTSVGNEERRYDFAVIDPEWIEW
jgi:hypothetical protein